MSKSAFRAGGWPTRPSSWPTIILILAVLLAGCASANTPTVRRATATSTATATPLPIPPFLQTPLTLQAAWGNVTIHSLPTKLADNRVFVFDNAATPDGQWLVGANEPRDYFTNTTHLSYAVLYNVATRQMLTMHPLLRPQSQILGASADAHWVVWSEADDQPYFYDWTLFAYNRQSGQVRQLAQAVRANGQPVQGPAPMPVVDHAHVVWGQPIGPFGPDTMSNAVVRMEDLTTGQITTLATKAGSPYITWPWVLWGQLTTSISDDGYVTIQNLETGQSVRLQQRPASFVMAGTSVAYDNDTTVFLLADVTKSTTDAVALAAAKNDADHLQFVTINDRLVAWTSDVVTEVYDRTEQRRVTIPVTRGVSTTWVGGHILVWGDPESQAQQDQDQKDGLTPTSTLHVIDTTTLPVLTGQ